MSRVLLVEDEALIRWSITERLRAEGFEIVEAADGATALEHISRNGISGLVVDLRLPDMSGVEVLREFRRHHGDSPAWMMTAYGTPEVESLARELEVDDFLNKPFDMDALVRKIKDRFNQISS